MVIYLNFYAILSFIYLKNRNNFIIMTEETKHILGYTQPKGKNKTQYKIYDSEKVS